jgi:hypothetical protein
VCVSVNTGYRGDDVGAVLFGGLLGLYRGGVWGPGQLYCRFGGDCGSSGGFSSPFKMSVSMSSLFACLLHFRSGDFGGLGLGATFLTMTSMLGMTFWSCAWVAYGESSEVIALRSFEISWLSRASAAWMSSFFIVAICSFTRVVLSPEMRLIA